METILTVGIFKASITFENEIDFLPSGVCFKIIHDHQKSRKRINSATAVASLETAAASPVFQGKRADANEDILSFVRVYSGELSAGSKIYNVNRLTREVCDKIYIPYANQLKQVAKLTCGNIGIVSGLTNVKEFDFFLFILFL